MQAELQLLTRDGAITVAFSRRLSAEQYADLLAVAKAPVTKVELCAALQELAYRWGILVEIEDGVSKHLRL